MDREILIKYLNNSCSEKELSEFLIWLNSSHSDEILVEISKSEWLALSENSVESGFERSELILDKIHQTINTRNNHNDDLIFDDENLKSLNNSNTLNEESLCLMLDLMKGCTPNEYKILCLEKSDEGTYSNNES